MTLEIEAHTVPDFKAPTIYDIMEYEGLEPASTFMFEVIDRPLL